MPDALCAVLDGLPVGVVLFDAGDDEMPILHVNAAAEPLVAAEPGQPAAAAFPSGSLPQALRKAREKGEPRRMRGYQDPASGRFYDVEISPQPGPTATRYLVASWHPSRDLVEDPQRLLLGVETLWRGMPLTELAAIAVEQAALLLPGVEAVVAIVPPRRPEQAIVAAASSASRERLVGRPIQLPEAYTGRPEELLGQVRHLLGGADAVHALPLATRRGAAGGRIGLGLIVFFRTGSTTFAPAEHRLMDEFASRLGEAMRRSQLLDDVEAAADRLQAATDAAIDLGDSLEPARVVERTLRRAAEEAEADLVVLLRRENGDLLAEGTFDREEAAAQVGYRISLAEDWPSRRALELGEPVLRSPELVGTSHPVGSSLETLKHSARVPLLGGGESGSLLLLGRRGGEPFTGDDVVLLEVLARHAAIAIRNARLYERAQTTARRLQVGVDMALDAATWLQTEDVVERILGRALHAVEAERATLGRLTDDSHCTILGSVDRRGDAGPVGLTVSIENQLPALEAVRTLRPAQGPVHHEGNVKHYYTWTVVVPLVIGGELVALLGVSGDRRPFSDDEVALLQQVGAVAALALRNATLFQTLRESNRVRSQFLNMAAHELRTPLSVISGYVSMLADGTLGGPPTTWEAPLAVLVAKTRELAHLVDDILLAGRLESGVARASSRTLDLRETVEEAVQRARARAYLIDAEVKLALPGEPVLATYDVDHVARILDNLLNNAFNYSPGPARVRVEVQSERGWAIVRVEDHGRGIPANQHEKIFQQFYRVDDPGSGYPPGTGLGLFISRSLAERHGGHLDLEWSEPGSGSRFALYLPLATGS